MAPLAFILPNALISFFLLGAGAEKPSCAYIEVARPILGSTEKAVEYRAPGHCERIINAKGAAKSRRFGCYSGCGGTKLQYQEFSDDLCQEAVLDTMIHRPPKQDYAWSTGPQEPENYLMEFDLGSVVDFDCGLAFCYVMETIENPVNREQPKLRHLPADRVSCTKVKTGYQWTRCMESGDLMVFENEVCGVDSEPTILQMQNGDNGKEAFSGVVREWECEGFDVIDSDEEDFAEHVLIEARMKTQRSAQSRREMALANQIAREDAKKHKGFDWTTVSIFLAIAAVPALLFTCRTCKKRGSNLKDMMPMPMSGRGRNGYSGLSQGDELVNVV